MFLCGLFKGEGKIAELTACWPFCIDTHSKSEILLKNYLCDGASNELYLSQNRKGWAKIFPNNYLIKYIYNNCFADFLGGAEL